MTEKTPPAIHTAASSPGLPTAPATIDGVPKIPAPTIRPTMIAVASPSDRTCAGPDAECCGGSPEADMLTAARRRPRERGDPVTFHQRHWIPACAGMTTRLYHSDSTPRV